MYCNKCNNTFSDSIYVCPLCDLLESHLCISCSANLKVDQYYCSDCGGVKLFYNNILVEIYYLSSGLKISNLLKKIKEKDIGSIGYISLDNIHMKYYEIDNDIIIYARVKIINKFIEKIKQYKN